MESSKCEYNGATSSQDSKPSKPISLAITQNKKQKVSAFSSYDDLVEILGSAFDEKQSIKEHFSF
jgi:hypothetical protein